MKQVSGRRFRGAGSGFLREKAARPAPGAKLLNIKHLWIYSIYVL